ncbi:amino acid permease-domain-containing protein [Auriculariales sp. MPI-PUGE-AT-0066]|nr:amino acid permease-domain-containing protein [Auriculariales sp. MPI-PUGE-AT-0066]
MTKLSTSLQQAGPAGVLIAYITTSTVVYATCISNAEMMSYMPDAGGLVGLADIFVDPALGFTLGWGVWYNWCIVAAQQLASAARLIKSDASGWTPGPKSTIYFNIFGAIFLIAVVVINFLRVERFGFIHSVFALLKLGTLTFLSAQLQFDEPIYLTCTRGLAALIITLAPVPLCCNTPGSAETLSSFYIGGSYWRHPGAFAQHPFGIHGAKGQIMGVFTVLIQSHFAFIGTEIGSSIGQELKNPATNTLLAVRRVWLRVTAVYILAVVAAGLVVPSDHEALNKAPSITGSPWTIAFATVTRNPVPRYVIVAFFSLSAASAASANIWVASRCLFFLAVRGHAPLIFRSLYTNKPPLTKGSDIEMTSVRPLVEPSSIIIPTIITPPTPPPMAETSTLHSGSASASTSLRRWPSDTDSLQPLLSPQSRIESEVEYMLHHSGSVKSTSTSTWPLHKVDTGAFSSPLWPTEKVYSDDTTFDPYAEFLRSSRPVPSSAAGTNDHAGRTPQDTSYHSHRPDSAVPWAGVLLGGAIGLLVFMAPAAESNEQVGAAMNFLTGLSSCTMLIGWMGMLITYLRFYVWTRFQEERSKGFKENNLETLYKNRALGQPWVAVYGLVWCIVLFLGQGWFVFVLPDANQFAQMNPNGISPDPRLGDFAWNFCAAYLPVGLLLLLYFGYKLVYQTSIVDLHEGVTHRVIQVQSEELPPRTLWGKFCQTLL